jgi:hypothetical protein
VVVAGVTVTGVLLATAPTPLLIVPVPPEKTAVRVVEFPAVMVDAPALKLLMTGGATPPTVRLAVPVMPLIVTEIVTVPLLTPVATPLALTVATDDLLEVHLADEEMFFCEPSLYDPVATNCWVWPTAIVAVAGETEIDCSTATPVPVSAAVCGLITALSLISNWPVRVPAAEGENFTAILHDPPAARVWGAMGQELLSEKSPVVWIEEIERAVGCALVT